MQEVQALLMRVGHSQLWQLPSEQLVALGWVLMRVLVSAVRIQEAVQADS